MPEEEISLEQEKAFELIHVIGTPSGHLPVASHYGEQYAEPRD